METKATLRSSVGTLFVDVWIKIRMFNEVIRIGGGKPLELELQLEMAISDEHTGENELYFAASLSDYPKNCTHLWNPAFWRRRLGLYPYGQVRERCRW